MRIMLLTVTLLGMLSVADPAHAGLSVKLQAVDPTSVGSLWQYTYELIFENDTATPQLVDDDFFTIYDVEGLVSATAPGGFSVSLQNVGINADGTTPDDLSTLPNVTFTRTAGIVTSDVTFRAKIVSTYGITKRGQYTAQSSAPELRGVLGRVPVATAVQPVPEPSTLLSGGMAAFVGLGLTWRRRRSASKVAA